MKRSATLLLYLILAATLFSCGNFQVSGKNSPTHVDPEYGYKTKIVSCSPSKMIDHFDSSAEIDCTHNAMHIYFTVPESWSGKGMAYKSYDKRISNFVRTFEIYKPVKVDADFVLSDDLPRLYKLDRMFSRKRINNMKMISGTTKNGYEYAAFVNEDANSYLMVAFVRTEADTIVPFSVVLSGGNSKIAMNCLDSIRYLSQDSDSI